MKRAVYGILGCFCVLGIYAQDERIKRIDLYLDLLENNKQGIAAVAISQGGELVYERQMGYMQMPDGIGGRNDLKGRIGSITKMVTATLIWQLVEEGKIDPAETLDRYFPEVPESGKITLLQMLNHTSGLGDIVVKNDTVIDWLLEPVSKEELLSEIVRQGVFFEPGDSVKYSNSAYYLLGQIVEKKYGRPYEEVVKEKITTPLGLKNTLSNVASGSTVLPSYKLNYNTQTWEETKDFYFPNVVGVGDMLSTPTELNVFIKALFNGELVSSSSVQQMLPEEGKMFGKGMMMVPFYEKMLYGHGGSTFGSYSLVAFQPEEQTAFSIIMNGQEMLMNSVLIGLLSIWYDRPFEFPVFADRDRMFDKSLYSSFEGVYGAEGFPIKINVFVKNEELYMQGTGQPSFSLEQVDDRIFDKKAYDVKVEFTEDGKMILTQGPRFVLEKETN
ncbi:MAG: beta-lactamase family protein [Tannerellaceae bacterium]|nr:beta-lactamase family protein [Tannerellaceae bacterium]